MSRLGSGIVRRGRHALLAGIVLATAAAGLSSPFAAVADPHPADHVAAARPGTPLAPAKPAGVTATARDQAHGKHVAKLAAPGTGKAGANGKATGQTAGQDGAEPGTGENGDGYVANQYDLPMTYNGSQDSAGIEIGPPKVYLVLWGSQWGTASTNSTGDVIASGDPDGAAPYQQDFFKGLGSAGDGWSAVLTQYCEGIQTGRMQCPANAPHIPYPQQGSVLAGVWLDNAAAAPDAATEPQIGAEVIAAAQHFGNTTEAQNRNVQYVIDSPHGTNPDHWMNNYCAWHDFERSQYGQLVYSNMPYLPDQAGCGANWFGENTPRALLDGYGIIGGHEYAETLSDPNTPGGWTDATGQELGDKCAWIPKGANGGLFFENLSTGSFPLQTLWSNQDHLCMASDPIAPSAPVTLSTMCDRTDAPGTPVNIPAVAYTDNGGTVRYSATGLPNGLTVNPSSGVISGTGSGTSNWQRVTVTAADSSGHSTSTGFWENVTASGHTGCNTGPEQLVDPGFENGSADVDHSVMTDAWSPTGGSDNPGGYNFITPSSRYGAHSGQWYAWLGQDGSAADDSIASQLNTYPGYSNATFSFWLDTETTNTTGTPDTLSLEVVDMYNGQVLGTAATWSSAHPTGGWQQQSVDVSSFVKQVGWGTTVDLKLVAHESGATPGTAFLVDDASGREY
ncbi:Ig domain-containing protein [Kitasatospora sp. NPDC006697]|uniref:Ig domain-containing protein n=1 Tax=Kitasatospora sp. NPDC006697 TaxID=3364020 RepID=UPI00369B6657